MDEQIRCIHCGKSHFIKKGFRKTDNRGKIQKYKCLECGLFFTNNDGFYRMRNNEKIITMSIDMYLSNLSSRKMRNQLKRHMETKVSNVSILDWVRKYVLKVHNFVEKQKPILSGKFYADETEVQCEGRNDIFWCNVDWDTRYISGFHYSTTRDINEGIEFIKKATKHKLPHYIQTDAAPLYPMVMKKLFYSRSMHGWDGDKQRVKHLINNVSKTKKHNVRIETVFSKIKDRVYDFRGFKALWSAPILMTGIILQHNFIEEHTTTRKRPYELAGIKIGIANNKWLELIHQAAQVTLDNPT